MTEIPGDVLMEAFRVLLIVSRDRGISHQQRVEAGNAAARLQVHLERTGFILQGRAA